MKFDPKTDTPEDSSGLQKTVKNTYDKLVQRGASAKAEALRNAGTLGQQASFIGQNIVEFDPEHDEDLTTASRVIVQNVYDALRELGHDELAEELRTYKTVSSQKRRSQQLAGEVDADIDPVTGDVEPAGGSVDDGEA